MRPRAVLLVALVLLLVAAPAAAQCSMCKEALAGDAPDGGNLGEGIFWSIVLLLSLPFTLTCGIVGMIIHSDRQRAAREQAPHRPDDDDEMREASRPAGDGA